MRRPSGLNATPFTRMVCPLSVSVSWPVTASQILTVVSSLAEAMRRPSELNATSNTASVCPLRVSVSWPVAASQILTVVSSVAEAMRRPSKLNATISGTIRRPSWPTATLAWECALRVSVTCPVAASQILTVASSLAEAMRRPSGLNATPPRGRCVP